MVRQQREKQQNIDIVIMEQMVSEDHLLRKADRVVDFSFIYELCAPLYTGQISNSRMYFWIVFQDA